MNKNSLKSRHNSDYSDQYLRTLHEVRTTWPTWKIEAYNSSFATSKHSQKIKAPSK